MGSAATLTRTQDLVGLFSPLHPEQAVVCFFLLTTFYFLLPPPLPFPSTFSLEKSAILLRPILLGKKVALGQPGPRTQGGHT